MIVPMFVVILALDYYPTLLSFSFSFYRMILSDPKHFAFLGFQNYVRAVADEQFQYAVARSFYFMAVSTVLVLLGGLGAALVLNEDFVGRTVTRVAMILPWAFPPVVNSLMWRWIYDPQFGALSGVLYQLGLISHYINFFMDPFVLLNMVIIVFIYRMIPFAALILLAALQSIPPDLHEAAKVDGASTWQRFRGVTLPLLKPALTIAIVIPSVFGFRVFDELYVIAGTVNTDTRTLMLLSYITNFVSLDFGYGSALTWIMTLIAIVFSYFYIKTMYKRIV